MSDELNTQQSAAPVTPSEGTQPAANTPPEAIPYSRFQEVNNEKKKLADQLQKLMDAESQRQQAEALKAGDFQKVIDDLKPKAERVDALESTLKKYLEAELATVPDQFKGLVPGGDVTMQLEWIRQAKATGLFGRTPAPNTDAGAVGDPKPSTVKLSEMEQQMARRFGMTDEDYIKFKS
jgi:hypothetical protein